MNNQFDRNKILAHLDSINKYVSEGTLDYPLLVEFDLTNVCNHDCPGCTGFRKEGGLNSAIETRDAIVILEDMKKCGTRAVTFSGGGDPTMHPDFDSIIEYAAKIGLEVGLITNGMSLKTRHFELLLSSCTWIRISWDAATPELHQKIHYEGDLGRKMPNARAFWQVVENTEMLCRHRDHFNHDCTIGCAFLVGPETKHEIVPFAKLASTMPVDYCQYRPFHYTSYDPETEGLMKEARERYQTKTFVVLFSEFKFQVMKEMGYERSYDICHGSHFATHIAANYEVYVCCHLMFSQDTSIGNLRKKSFINIWNSALKKEVINRVNVHKCVPLCRHDSANRILQTIVSSDTVNHKNFL